MMKSILPWFCLAAVTNATLAFADKGLDAYRLGNYKIAADLLIDSTNKDPIVDFYLGKMRLYGYGELKNNKLSIDYLQKAGEKGLLSAQNIMARYELLETKNLEKALYWFKKAAVAEDNAALMYCAAAYSFGVGTKINHDLARKYYIAAAKKGDSIAQYTVAKYFLDSKNAANKKLGMIWLNKSLQMQNPEAQLMMADLYMRGSMVSKDLTKARELINLAIDKRYLPAYFLMGELSYLENNYKEAQQWYTKAASADYIPAILQLSKFYSDKKNEMFNQHEAFLWMLKASQLGSSKACLALSDMYKNGVGVNADDSLAESFKKKAKISDNFHTNAQTEAVLWLTDRKFTKFDETNYNLHGIFTSWHNLNNLIENNYNQPPQFRNISKDEIYKPNFKLVDPNQISIAEYYNILLSGKNIESGAWQPPTYLLPDAKKLTENNKVLREQQHASLGFDYLLQDTMSTDEKIDYKKEFAKLEERAVIGDTIAQFDVGQMYQYGIGVEKDAKQAVKFYELAASQGSLPAEYNLGIIYLLGDGVNQDLNLALKWLQDAAFKGNDYAQYVLAHIYENGYKDTEGKEIIKTDKDKSLAMYKIAAANNYGPAQFRLAEIMVREKPVDLSESGKVKRNRLIKELYAQALSNYDNRAKLPLAYYNAMEKSKKKLKLAYKVASQESAKGNKDAALLLALMYDRGIVVAKDNAAAIRWYQQAGDNTVSSFIIGTYTALGQGLDKNPEKAKELLEKAVQSNFSYANLNLAVLNKLNKLEFLDNLSNALEQGNSTAGLLLADYYLSESSDKKQLQSARKIYETLAKQGDKNAQFKLGYLYEKGIGGKVDYISAKNWYKKAAHQNQAQAQFLLARLYQLGKVDSLPNIKLAKKWYKAASAVYPRAAVALGFLYDTAEDNYQNALINYKFADEHNEILGAFNLGLIYERGQGVAVDFEKAQNLYLKAAKAGHKESMVQLAGLYLNGKGIKQDLNEAFDWYKKAADLGDRTAMYHLGLLYETGTAPKLNYDKARDYYKKSAKLGDAKAKLALARIYQYGIGGEKNLDESVNIYNTLSKHGNAYAEYQLAGLCFKGIPENCSLKQGISWLEKSQANGNKEAGTMLNLMKAKNDNKLSFIQPMPMVSKINIVNQESPDFQYLEALNAWNAGNEKFSKELLYRIITKYPNNFLAKETYKLLYLNS